MMKIYQLFLVGQVIFELDLQIGWQGKVNVGGGSSFIITFRNNICRCLSLNLPNRMTKEMAVAAALSCLETIFVVVFPT